MPKKQAACITSNPVGFQYTRLLLIFIYGMGFKKKKKEEGTVYSNRDPQHALAPTRQ